MKTKRVNRLLAIIRELTELDLKEKALVSELAELLEGLTPEEYRTYKELTGRAP